MKGDWVAYFPEEVKIKSQFLTLRKRFLFTIRNKKLK